MQKTFPITLFIFEQYSIYSIRVCRYGSRFIKKKQHFLLKAFITMRLRPILCQNLSIQFFLSVSLTVVIFTLTSLDKDYGPSPGYRHIYSDKPWQRLWSLAWLWKRLEKYADQSLSTPKWCRGKKFIFLILMLLKKH